MPSSVSVWRRDIPLLPPSLVVLNPSTVGSPAVAPWLDSARTYAPGVVVSNLHSTSVWHTAMAVLRA